MCETAISEKQRIIKVTLDEQAAVCRSPQVEHELKVALYDLSEENTFDVVGDFEGPYNLHVGIEETRLFFDVRNTDDEPLTRFTLALSTVKSVVKEYFLICDSYFKAIKNSSPSQIEAIDMGRRGLHNDGAEILKERLADKVNIDKDTARRLFTLVCVLHIRA